MKGGVTSGIVYPDTIGAMTQRYCLRIVGGISAGAIASGRATAMDYRLGSSRNAQARQ